MPIRPVDPQSVLQRISEFQRTLAADRDRPQDGQHHFLQQLERESTRQQQTVRQAEDSESTKLSDDDEQARRQKQSRDERRRLKQKAEPKVAGDQDRGTHLDIKV